MLCPQCSNNQKRSEGMQCGSCHYGFLLDPKERPYLSDRRFLHFVGKVSEDGERWFTAHQLHGLLQHHDMGWAAAVRRAGSNRRRVPRPPEETVATVARWVAHGRPIRGLIDRPALGVPAPNWPEPDLYDYGAENVLVVDQPLLVDVLVRNGVHARARTAIIDASGYPSGVTRRVADLIAHRPDLRIFLLHSSADGAAAPLEAYARSVLGASANPVIDLGLSHHVSRELRFLRWAKHTVVPADVLSHKWLTTGVESAIAAGVSLVGLARGGGPSFSDDDFG